MYSPHHTHTSPVSPLDCVFFWDLVHMQNKLKPQPQLLIISCFGESDANFMQISRGNMYINLAPALRVRTRRKVDINKPKLEKYIVWWCGKINFILPKTGWWDLLLSRLLRSSAAPVTAALHTGRDDDALHYSALRLSRGVIPDRATGLGSFIWC